MSRGGIGSFNAKHFSWTDTLMSLHATCEVRASCTGMRQYPSALTMIEQEVTFHLQDLQLRKKYMPRVGSIMTPRLSPVWVTSMHLRYVC
jgi:hypothetical protein